MNKPLVFGLLLTTLSAMGGCANVAPQKDDAPLSTQLKARSTAQGEGVAESIPASQTPSDSDKDEKVVVFEGSGDFIDREAATKPTPASPAPGDYTLNFVDAEIGEVVKTILGDTLEHNFVIDPKVNGKITLQTTRPLTREELLPALEMFLRMNGAALVVSNGFYHVVPTANALANAGAPRLIAPGQGMPDGVQIRLIPLEYIAAAEMQKILEPLIQPKTILRVDKARNLLMAAGSGSELERMLETIDIFDVNWLEGMSVGMFRLEHVELDVIMKELEAIFGEGAEGPLAGMFRLLPIERLNAVMVFSPQEAYLKEAETWIRRLDQGGGGDRRLHVYRVQNAKAEDLADVLSEIFSGESSKGKRASGPVLAPGAKPATVSTNGGGDGASQGGAKSAASSQGAASGALKLSDIGDVRIIADEPNNSLIVLATDKEYETIESALDQLDILPLQVLVDATIVEVTLTDELKYGLQWFFTEQLESGQYTGDATLSFDKGGAIAASFPGFSYSLVEQAEKVRAVLNALANDSKIDVLSAPSVMVLDNQEASIQVGNQVPVRTSESTSTSTSASNPIVTSTIQYKDAGVKLTVKPRVNAGGMVIMEIAQEVNDVSTTTTSGIDSPTIQQRQIDSTVAIQSGETVVLGGLIKESRSNSNSGIPGLKDIPGLGFFFGQTDKTTRRTELIVLITPHVAASRNDARGLTEEFRQKLKSLDTDWSRDDSLLEHAEAVPTERGAR